MNYHKLIIRFLFCYQDFWYQLLPIILSAIFSFFVSQDFGSFQLFWHQLIITQKVLFHKECTCSNLTRVAAFGKSGLGKRAVDRKTLRTTALECNSTAQSALMSKQFPKATRIVRPKSIGRTKYVNR